MTTSPKKRFQEINSGKLASEFRDLTSKESLLRACDFAILETLDGAPDISFVNGARSFLENLMNLGDPPKPPGDRTDFNLKGNR